MELERLEKAKKWIECVGECHALPTEEQVAAIRELTGRAWTAEELRECCVEYWSHHSLEETAYFLFHGDYPPARKRELGFWRYKAGAVLDDEKVYDTYRLGRKPLKALEPLPIEEILEALKKAFPGWRRRQMGDGNLKSWRYDPPKQASPWSGTHFWLFVYGRETGEGREDQLLLFECHNMGQAQQQTIKTCMEEVQCPLHRDVVTQPY